MPHLVQMDKDYRKKGLKIVAAEVRGSSKETIGKIVEGSKVGFSVTKGAQGPVSIAGMPQVLAFGADGKLIFKGHPESEEFEDILKKALEKVKVTEVETKPLAKPLVKLLDRPGDTIEQRTWTNSEGVKMVAAITKIEGEKVIFRLQKNGKIVPYLISKLSGADQKLIQEKVAEE